MSSFNCRISAALLAGIAFGFVFSSETTAQTRDTQWYPYVIARPADRAQIQSLPYHMRPYRPLHFYGNSVRRSYDSGSQGNGLRPVFRERLLPIARQPFNFRRR